MINLAMELWDCGEREQEQAQERDVLRFRRTPTRYCDKRALLRNDRLRSDGLCRYWNLLLHLRVAHILGELVVCTTSLASGHLRRNRARLHVGSRLLAGDRTGRVTHGCGGGLGRLGVRCLLVGSAHVARLAVRVVGGDGPAHSRVAASRCVRGHVLVRRIRARLRVGGPSRRGAHSLDLRAVEALRLWDGGHEVAARLLVHLADVLHAQTVHALDVLARQVRLALLLTLCQRHVQGLAAHDTPVHLRDGLGRLVRRRKAHETEALRAALVQHHLGRGNRTVWGELLTQPLIVDGVVQSSLPSDSSLPFSSCTARSAASGLSNATKPNPRLLPSFVITRWLVIEPYFSNISRRASSVRSSPKFFTYTLVNSFAFSPSSFSRSLREMKRPTYTFFSFSNMPFTFSIEVFADSSVSKCTNP
uniref:Uncharacterized protein n=1 Tax=Anopheles atroparvus TaxID=41427 RepID=A0A182JCY2_ANOAO